VTTPRTLTAQDALALHATYAPDAEQLERVGTHCRIVARIALDLARRHPAPVDSELVEVGALLHDIGVYQVGTGPYIRHGILGHALLEREGLPQPLLRFASCHTGVGISRQDVREQRLPIPEADYLPETVEERLVAYADKFHSKGRQSTFLSADTYRRELAARFGTAKAEVFDTLVEEFGLPDIDALAAEYGQSVRR
jgi:uncharacterized protein